MSDDRLYAGFAEPRAVVEGLFRRLDGLSNIEKRNWLGISLTHGVICEITYERLMRDLGLK